MTTTPQRRTRGSGSIRERMKGVWQIRYDGAPDGDGNTKKVAETIRGSKRDAERILRERLGTVDSGTYVTKQKETVGEFLDKWLKTYASTNTSLRTQQGYRVNIRRALPYLGAIQVQGLQPTHIQRMYAELLEKGLGARTIHHTHSVLRKAMNDAVKWGTIVRNPLLAVDPPRPKASEPKVWDTDTLAKFFRVAAESKFRDLFHLTAQTGMRRSELCGLRWEHVNLDEGSISVVGTLQRIVGHGLVEGQPKRNTSRRKIAITESAVALLHGVRRRQLEARLAAGPVWNDTDYVFTQADGKAIDADRISREFAKVVRQGDLPHLTFHGLRHIHATLLLKAGVHPKVVSERLGHSKVGLTMDTYSHVLPDMQQAAVEAIERELGAVLNV